MSDSESTVLANGKYVRLISRNGWEFVDRHRVSGIVGIIAVNDDGRLILVEQFREPVNRNVIELPAGLAGDVAGSEDEALESAARRELLEESGYEAGRMIRLMDGASSAGVTSEIITLFLAESVKKISHGGGDGSERIVVHEIPLEEVDAWVRQRQEAEGVLVDFKVYAGMFFMKGL